MVSIVELSTNPPTKMFLRSLEGGTATSKWIENKPPGIGGNQYCTFGNDQLKFVYTGPHFELFMSVRRRIRPEIGQIYAAGIHLIPMPPVVADFLTAMPTCLDRQTNFVEHCWYASGVVKKRIMRGIKLLSSGIGPFHCKRNPVPETKFLAQNRRELYRQFRRRVQKEGTARFQNAAAFTNPIAAPRDVFSVIYVVVVTILVVFPKIEGGICKNGIYDSRLHLRQYSQAIRSVEYAI